MISHRTQLFGIEFKIDKLENLFIKTLTRSQKRRIVLQESNENVSEIIVSPVLVENGGLVEQDVLIANRSHAKSPRVEYSNLESLRASLKE